MRGAIMSIMNDLNAYASELFAKEEISKDYYKKPENEYEKMNKLVMDALKNFYGDDNEHEKNLPRNCKEIWDNA